MKILKAEIVEMDKIIKQVENLSGVYFAEALELNREKISSIIKSLEKASQPDPKFIEFQKKKYELIKKFGILDETGEPIPKTFQGNQIIYDIQMNNISEYNSLLKNLEEEYLEVIEQNNKYSTEIQELLQEELDIEFVQIPIEKFPENITPAQMRYLKYMVKKTLNKTNNGG